MLKRVHNDEHLADIREVIEAYASGANRRDIDALDRAFHDQFRVVAMIPGGVMDLDKETYIEMARDGKLGGVERGLDIEWITSAGNTARAEVRHHAPDKTFHDDLALIDDGSGWKIVNNVTRVVPV